MGETLKGLMERRPHWRKHDWMEFAELQTDSLKEAVDEIRQLKAEREVLREAAGLDSAAKGQSDE